jgi:hypothetical protein
MAFEVFDATKTTTPITASGAAQLLGVMGASAKLEGKFEISDSIHLE